MENKSGFNLESALARWREEMRLARGMTADQVRELETHLRDSYARLEGTELTPEERFVIAQRRLGEPEALESEFQKLPPRTAGRPSRLTATIVWAVAIGSFAALVLGELGMRIMSTSAHITQTMQVSPSRSFAAVALVNSSFLAPLLVTALGFFAVWAYLRARRQSIRVGIIVAAFVLPSLLGALYGILWLGARALGALAIGGPFLQPPGFHPMSLGGMPPVLTSMFKMWWLALWTLLACREIYVKAKSSTSSGNGLRARLCQALDAE